MKNSIVRILVVGVIIFGLGCMTSYIWTLDFVLYDWFSIGFPYTFYKKDVYLSIQDFSLKFLIVDFIIAIFISYILHMIWKHWRKDTVVDKELSEHLIND